jgi:hypothetical protein
MAIVRLEKLCKLKNSVTWYGVEPKIIQLETYVSTIYATTFPHMESYVN